MQVQVAIRSPWESMLVVFEVHEEAKCRRRQQDDMIEVCCGVFVVVGGAHMANL